MAIKKGLGKGLSALIPTENLPGEENSDSTKQDSTAGKTGNAQQGEAGEKSGEILVAIEKLKPNPNQPRKSFDEGELAELADSIRQQGIIQPIIAEDSNDGTYTIIAGERRTRAAKLAGLQAVPVVLRKYAEEKLIEVSLIENIQRSDLNPIEEAEAYRQLMGTAGLSQDEAAVRVGKNRATVANTLRLLKLPGEIQESIRKGEISPGHARAILSLNDARSRETLFQEILKKGMSVREAEKRAAALGEQNKKSKKTAVRLPPELAAIEEKFIARLGTKVIVNGNLKKGTIVIDYYSMEDLDRLLGLLG